jgi:hypothetical protein
VISAGKATFAELDSVLGVEDLHDIIEVITVDAHNRAVIERDRQEKERWQT